MVNIKKIGFNLIILIFLVLFSSIAFGHLGHLDEDIPFPTIGSCFLLNDVEKDQCYSKFCSDKDCAELLVISATSVGGSVKGFEVIKFMEESSDFTIQGDIEYLSKLVGRTIAQHYGDKDSFNKCTSEYDNNCFYGYFEYRINNAMDERGFFQKIGDGFKSLSSSITGLFVKENKSEQTSNAVDKSVSKSGRSSKSKIDLNNLAILTPDLDSQLILNDDNYIEELLKKYTLDSITSSLNRVGSSQGINCHNRAHELGRIAYEVIGEDAFQQCGNECHSGCRHGATEAFFAEHGTANLENDLNVICSSERSSFFTHQCLHGIGHGLMAWTDYEIHDALESCDMLNSQPARSSCYTGIFMENIVGGLSPEVGHYSQYLNDDPHFPCNILDDKYKSECYFLQTDRMYQLSGYDLTQVGIDCANAPARFRQSCFNSMGRTVSGATNQDPVRSIPYCEEINNSQDSFNCLNGVLQDQFWDESQADKGLRFCTLVEDMEDYCYTQIIGRAANVIFDERRKKEFCEKIPQKHRASCFNMLPTVMVLNEGSKNSNAVNVKSEIQNPNEVIVKYINGKYEPRKVTISQGGRVTWINEGDLDFWPATNIHPTHAVYPDSHIDDCDSGKLMFDACKGLGKGSSYYFVFNEKGIWRYHDHINPTAGGLVIVN